MCSDIRYSGQKTQTLALNLQEEPAPSAAEGHERDYSYSTTNSKLETRRERDSGGPGAEDGRSDRLKETDAEATVASLIAFCEKMMSKKQLLITLISFVFGAYAVYIGLIRDTSVYGYESRHHSAHSIKSVLIVYGSVQLLLSTVFFLTYAATATIAESRWGCQIVGGVIGCVIYLLVAFVVLIVGVAGFYHVMALYGQVEYEDRQSVDFVDQVLYKSALFIFIFHICFMLLKCCWWCR